MLRFENIPSVLRIPGMLLLWSGGSESCIERMAFEGRADADGSRLAQGIVEVHVEWKAR